MNFDIINPRSTKDLFDSVKKLQKTNIRFAAGCTDLLLDIKKHPINNLTIINLSQVADKQFTSIKKLKNGYWLGARVTATMIVESEELKKNFQVLYEAAHNLASTQIRQVATIGGNLCTASPSGDIACALVALEAECEILSSPKKKKLISIKDFFLGPRKTALGKNDLLYGIYIPVKAKKTVKTFSGFIKIGTRKSMECSVVSLAYHIQADGAGIITHAGVAIGASAPTIRFASSACQFITGKNIYTLSETEIVQFAKNVLSYASPISDLRATAWYRKEVLFNIGKGLLENIQQ